MKMQRSIVSMVLLCVIGFALPTFAQSSELEGLDASLLPDMERLHILESNPDEHPVLMLNLLKFKPNGGRAAYMRYGMAASKRTKELGAEIIFLGAPIALDDQAPEWDTMAMVRYQSRKDLRRLGESEEYVDALKFREEGLITQILYAFNGEQPPRSHNAERVILPIGRPASSPDPNAIYVLNLMRFKPDGGKELFYRQYATLATRALAGHGGSVVMALNAEQIMMGDEEYDQLFLITFPSLKAYSAMIESDYYKLFEDERTAALEVDRVYAYRRLPTGPPAQTSRQANSENH